LAPELAKKVLLNLLNRRAQAKGIRNEEQISTLLAVQQLLRGGMQHPRAEAEKEKNDLHMRRVR
jgi:hypothetical protein